MKKLLIGTVIGLIGMTSSIGVMAADFQVKMLNQGKNGTTMVFEPAFVKAKVGDTVTFIPEQKGGHNVKSLIIPKDAKDFVSKPDEKITVKLEKEGVYAYSCEPHKMMGMVGLIQVGKPTNLADVTKIVKAEETKFVMNKDVYSKLLKEVK